MKFVYNFYALIIILRSSGVVQNATDFTLEELTHISRNLNPIECMRLLEAIYSATPVNQGHTAVRNTLLDVWVSKHACLEELKAWKQQYPDKIEPKARVVMSLHLNALGKADLAKYVRKNSRVLVKPLCKGNTGSAASTVLLDVANEGVENIVDHRIYKRDVNGKRSDLYRPRKKRVVHYDVVPRSKTDPRKTNQYYKIIRRPMIAAVAEESVFNTGEQASALQSSAALTPGGGKHFISKESLIIFLIAALSLTAILSFLTVMLMFRRPLITCLCNAERRNDGSTREKGLQCIGVLSSNQNDCTKLHKALPVSEIDVEGRSCSDSVYAVQGNEGISSQVHKIERLELLDEESAEFFEKCKPTLCRCRPIESDVSEPECEPRKNKKKKKKKKKRKKKVEVEEKEETKKPKSYLKAIQEKFLQRRKCRGKTDCSFDMEQFQDKILTILHQECPGGECCGCSHRGQDVEEYSERCVTRKVPRYQESVQIARSPVSSNCSSTPQELDTVLKKNRVRKSTRRKKRAKERVRVTSSSSECEKKVYEQNSCKKRRKVNSKRSNLTDGSVNKLICSARDQSKRLI